MIREDKIEEVIKEITDDIKSRTDIATVGLSGGADSTLVSILCTIALGKENIYGYGMPYNDFDRETFNSRSESLANKLEINYREIPITRSVDDTIKCFGRNGSVGGEGLSELNKGNLRSRMRMVNLYMMNCHIGEVNNVRSRVIGTGNLSEDFIFYDTKFGDSAADLFPIGNLFKSEVYQLLDYFVTNGTITEDMVDRIPSAGLWNGQTDEDEIGYTYDEMEPVIRFCEENYETMDNICSTLMIYPDFPDAGSKGDTITAFVWDRHKQGKHKHDPVPVTQVNEANFKYD